MRFKKRLGAPKIIRANDLVLYKVGKRLFEIGLSLDIVESLFVIGSEGALASDDCGITK